LAAARFTDFQPRGAEAALRDAGHGLRPLGVEHRGARDVGALLAHRRDAAQHHVVDQRWCRATALLQRLQQRAQQPHRRGLVQAAVLLALATRRAHVVVDEGFAHVDDAQLGQRGVDVGALLVSSSAIACVGALQHELQLLHAAFAVRTVQVQVVLDLVQRWRRWPCCAGSAPAARGRGACRPACR
jgi:hypothetical protein